MTKKSSRKSRTQASTRSFAYSQLEPRALLATASLATVSMYDDVFADGAVTTQQILDRATTNDFVPDQIIVAIKSPVAKSNVDPFLASINWQELTGNSQTTFIRHMMTMERGENQNASLVHLDLGKNGDPLEMVEKLAASDQVIWSSPNFIHAGSDPRELVPNDPSYGQQYFHPLMQNHLAWDITLGNPDIKVGVTDDGVDLFHPDLIPNIWINPGETAGNAIDDDGNGYIDDVKGWDFSSNNNDPGPNGTNTHGTHVAGITAGRTNNGIGIAGTAGLATIVPMQFYAGAGSWTAAIINATYSYAADNNIQIVTTSYNVDGWVGDPVFLAGLQYMYNAGVLHFNSAGNNNQLNPARQVFEESIFVASTDQNDLKSSFSNFGNGVDISAPGSSIFSTLINNAYGNQSGTSMSTPNAAGAAALIWGQNPTWTRDQVAAQLLHFADNIDSLNPTFAGWLGSGRANPYRALTNTLPAPKVKSVASLPASGATVSGLNANSFTVSFDQVMDSASVNNLSNYELRSAGTDNLFGTVDDILFSLSSAGNKQYRVGTNSMTFNFAGGQLPLGKYQLTMVAGGLRNPFNTALDGNSNGTGGDNYVHAFTIEPTTVKYPSLGSLVVEQNWTAGVDTAGQTFDYNITVGAGQTLTVVSQPAGSLVPTIQIRNSSGTLLGSGSMVGTSSVVRNVTLGSAGQYRITFGGNGSSTGVYNARLLLNSDIEQELLAGTLNDSSATAQDIDSSALSLGNLGADRLAIRGAKSPNAGSFFSESFSSSTLSSNWSTASTATGRIRVVGGSSTAAGPLALFMDSTTNSSFSLNQATLTLNLTGLDTPILKFSEISLSDEIHSMPASFINTSNTDGVAISADGVNWFRVWTPAVQVNNIWTQRTVDLNSAAAAAGITLGANFQIRFQQYDNFPDPTDGRGFDEISIAVNSFDEDWFTFTLADGEYASIVSSHPASTGSTGSTGSTEIELFNNAGISLASGSSAANASSMVSRLQDTTTNGTRDTYRVRLRTTAPNYSLIVTRKADFDREQNDSSETAQNLNGFSGVLGFANTTPDVYRFDAKGGEFIRFRSSLPYSGLNQFGNDLGSGSNSLLRMVLVNPSGRKVAIGSSSVFSTSNSPGTWQLLVYAAGGQGGEYFVQRDPISDGPRLTSLFDNGTAAQTKLAVLPEKNRLRTNVPLNRIPVDPDSISTSAEFVDVSMEASAEVRKIEKTNRQRQSHAIADTFFKSFKTFNEVL